MSLQTRLQALITAIGADIKSLNTQMAGKLGVSAKAADSNLLDGLDSTAFARTEHKYHSFSNGQYFFDDYEQKNYFRLFTENAAYTQTRFQPVYDVEYWDGSAWIPWAAGVAGIKTLLDGREDTGTSIPHAQRKFRFTVQCNSGWATAALYFLQGTWTGFGYTAITTTIEESSVLAGPYTLRDTALFDAPNTASQHGLHAKITTSLHNGQVFRRITIDIEDWVDSGGYTTFPLRRFEILSNYSGGPLLPFSWNYDRGLNVPGTLNSVGTLTENGNRVYSAANPPTGFLPVGGKAADSELLDGLNSTAFLLAGAKAADSELLDGIDSTEFLRKGIVGSNTTSGVNTRTITSVNQYLSSGYYDGNNVVGAPDANWWLYLVITHANHTAWTRQFAYAMTGGTQHIYHRRCQGTDPTVPGNWTAWERIDAAAFYAAGSKVADSDLLDGINSTAFLRTDITQTLDGGTP